MVDLTLQWKEHCQLPLQVLKELAENADAPAENRGTVLLGDASEGIGIGAPVGCGSESAVIAAIYSAAVECSGVFLCDSLHGVLPPKYNNRFERSVESDRFHIIYCSQNGVRGENGNNFLTYLRFTNAFRKNVIYIIPIRGGIALDGTKVKPFTQLLIIHLKIFQESLINGSFQE